MKQKQKKKFIINKKWIPNIVLLGISIILTIAFALFSLMKNRVEKVTYTENSNIDYMVCLKKNNYFKEKCLDNTKNSYVADILDYITLDFSYFMNVSTKIDQEYNYNITAKILATDKEDSSKVVYNKTTTLVENKKVNDNSKSIANMKEQVKINYADYNDIITNFKKDYVLALDANLIITMNINYKGKYSKDFDEINTAKQMSVTIPLSEQMITITTSTKKENKTSILEKKEKGKTDKIIMKGLIGLDAILAGILIFSIMKSLPYKKEYLKELEKILKEYDRAIVSTNNLPSFKNHNQIEVPTFEELLDARENLERPILYYQSKTEDKVIFCIMANKEVYIYTLEAKDKKS